MKELTTDLYNGVLVKIKRKYIKPKVKLNQMMYLEVSIQYLQAFVKSLDNAKINKNLMD
jgi:hypothetical protein